MAEETFPNNAAFSCSSGKYKTGLETFNNNESENKNIEEGSLACQGASDESYYQDLRERRTFSEYQLALNYREVSMHRSVQKSNKHQQVMSLWLQATHLTRGQRE